MNVYTPILVLGLLAFGFAAFSVTAATITGPKRYNRAKYDAYECGIEPTPQPIGGGRFPVKYYLTAMLFIVFDIETVFMLPWAAYYQQLSCSVQVVGRMCPPGYLSFFGLGEMLVFVGILLVGFIYVWKKGALQWD